jgi:hypothetical protein
VKSGEKLQKVLILLVTWGLLLVFFVGYEVYFVRGEQQFLQANGFRSLAARAKELSAKFAKARASTESYLRLAHEPNIKSEALGAYRKLYLNSPSIVTDAMKLKNCVLDNPESGTHVPLAFIPRDNELMLSVYCFERKSDDNDTPKPDSKLQLYTLDIRSWLADAFQDQANDFDDIVVADESGRVVFETSTSGPQIADLKALVPQEVAKDDKTAAGRSSSNVERNNGADNTGRKGTKQQPSQTEKLNGASSVTTITYAGNTYQLFSQPVRIWLPNSPTGGEILSFGIYGLWDEERFEDASRRIPYSTLIWASLVAIALLSLSWPLFKLRYMGSTERFNAVDGWLLVLAVSLASASVTLMLLNASYISHAQDDVDQNLKVLGTEIKDHLQDEMRLASKQLGRFSRNIPKAILQSRLVPSYLKANVDPGANPLIYPYFADASWLDCNGQQVAKVDVRPAPTPTINVSTRAYFRRVMSDAKQLVVPSEHPLNSGNHQAACSPTLGEPPAILGSEYLEPILSGNTDEFSAILSGPFTARTKEEKDRGIRVEALSLIPLSLVDPVLPPGYRFAVIDGDCNVMFHSDSFRNLRENFCDESKDQDELRPWLFAGVDTPIDISYQGHPARAYMTPINSPTFVGGQPFLLVFREPDVDLTLNLAVVLVCSVLLATYFGLLVAIAVIYLVLKGPLRLIYAPGFIWPQRDKSVGYLQLFAANVVLLLLFWSFYPRLYEAPLVGLTVAVAVVAVLLTLFKLASPRWGPLVLSGFLICGTFAVWSTLYYYDRDTLSDWEAVLAVLALASLVAALFAEAISSFLTTLTASVVSKSVKLVMSGVPQAAPRPLRLWVERTSSTLSTPGWLSRFAQRHFGLAYVLAILSIVTASVLVPCIGFFKYGYDAVSELYLKHNELVLSQRVLDRRARIHHYYDDKVNAPPQIAQKRLGAFLDRYDALPPDSKASGKPFFFVVDPPSMSSPRLQGAKPCNQETRNHPINYALERWMARATLSFPGNTLGREMSKLGVASTEKDSRNAGYYWTEQYFTNFQLVQTTDSGQLIISTNYQDWWGLRWQDRILLLPLWIILSFWLMIVVNKIFFATIEDTSLDTIDWKDVSDIKKNFLIIERAKSGRAQWMAAIANLPPDSRLDLRLELKKFVEGKSIELNCPSPILILGRL